MITNSQERLLFPFIHCQNQDGQHLLTIFLWVYLSAHAAITKCHRLGCLNDRKLFSHNSGAWEVQSVIRFSVWKELSYWFLEGCFLCVASRGVALVYMRGERASPLVSLIRTLILSDQDPTLMTSL